MDRFRKMLILSFFLSIAPGLAFAAESIPDTPSEWAFWVLTILIPVGVLVFKKVSPITENKVDDRISDLLGGVDAADALAMLKRWLDPDDPAVPPSPANPTGEDR